MMTQCSDIIANSNIQFGTSGARGLVDDFTPEVCGAFTQAFVEQMQSEYEFSGVVLAIDNRPSSPAIAEACAGVIKQLGLAVYYYGVVPTPALAYQAMQDKMPAIMVTGSHIPFDRNGLKFYRPDGEITKADEAAILGFNVSYIGAVEHALPAISTLAAERYTQRNAGLYADHVLAGKRIGIYEHSSAGRDLYAAIFASLGAEVISLERTDTFVPIDTEAVAEEDRVKARQWSAEHQLDAIFSTDGDGDRPLIADETGEWLRGDIVGLLCAQLLNIQALAVPVSCNTAIEKSNSFEKVVRTRIGSPYVIAAFEALAAEFKRLAGFEANGGFILGSDVELNAQVLKALPTRDALLPGIVLIAGAASAGKLLSELVASLPARYTASDRIKDVPTQWSRELLNAGAEQPEVLLSKIGFTETIEAVDTTDGLRLTLASGDIVHLRPSGNAPELRCYAESGDQAVAEAIVVKALKGVKVLTP